MTRRFREARRAAPARRRRALVAILWIGALSVSGRSLYAQAVTPVSQAQPPTGVSAQASDTAPAPTLTLSQALMLARQNNRQIRIAGLQIAAAQQQTAAARTGLLPSITLQAAGGQLLDSASAHFPAGALGTVNGSPVPSRDMDVKSSDRFTTAYTLGIAQPITQIPRIRTGIRLQEVGVEIAREQERQRKQTSAATVRQVYHAILQTQETITADKEQLKALQQLEHTVGENVRQETALKADLLEVQARRTGQEAALSTARDTLQQLKEQLNLLLARDTQTPFDVVPVTDDTPFNRDENALIARALQGRPELRVNALQVRQAELDRRMTELERVPNLSLAMNYAALQSNLNGFPDHVWTAGFQVSWDGLDWGRRRRESAAKTHVIEQTRLALEEARSQVQIEVRNQVRRWRQARETENAARAAQQAAQERLRVATNQFQANASLLKDVLQAQASLADANRQVQDAALASLTAQSELLRSLGEE